MDNADVLRSSKLSSKKLLAPLPISAAKRDKPDRSLSPVKIGLDDRRDSVEKKQLTPIPLIRAQAVGVLSEAKKKEPAFDMA